MVCEGRPGLELQVIDANRPGLTGPRGTGTLAGQSPGPSAARDSGTGTGSPGSPAREASDSPCPIMALRRMITKLWHEAAARRARRTPSHLKFKSRLSPTRDSPVDSDGPVSGRGPRAAVRRSLRRLADGGVTDSVRLARLVCDGPPSARESQWPPPATVAGLSRWPLSSAD